MSYFAKPNFIIYDEWFDDNLEKTNFYLKNKKIKTISNIHQFFYEQSNYKVGASENKLESYINENKRAEFNINNLSNNLDKDAQLSIIKFGLFEKLSKSKLKFNLIKKIIYSLSIFGFILIVGCLMVFITQSKTNESKIINKPIVLKK